MLQRIQTVYLLLVLACLGLTFAFPFAEFDMKYVLDNQGAFLLDRSQSLETLLPFPMAYIAVSLIGLTAFTILAYRDRKKQLLLGKLSYLLILGFVVCVYMSIDHIVDQLGGESVKIEYLVSTYLPVIALVFLFLANRGIKRDEELVKSLDRLR